jgi:hypothetical protein
MNGWLEVYLLAKTMPFEGKIKIGGKDGLFFFNCYYFVLAGCSQKATRRRLFEIQDGTLPQQNRMNNHAADFLSLD